MTTLGVPGLWVVVVVVVWCWGRNAETPADEGERFCSFMEGPY